LKQGEREGLNRFVFLRRAAWSQFNVRKQGECAAFSHSRSHAGFARGTVGQQHLVCIQNSKAVFRRSGPSGP
jgi:hypothetical protein